MATCTRTQSTSMKEKHCFMAVFFDYCFCLKRDCLKVSPVNVDILYPVPMEIRLHAHEISDG